jgi:hypothetical protein
MRLSKVELGNTSYTETCVVSVRMQKHRNATERH